MIERISLPCITLRIGTRGESFQLSGLDEPQNAHLPGVCDDNRIDRHQP